MKLKAGSINSIKISKKEMKRIKDMMLKEMMEDIGRLGGQSKSEKKKKASRETLAKARANRWKKKEGEK